VSGRVASQAYPRRTRVTATATAATLMADGPRCSSGNAPLDTVAGVEVHRLKEVDLGVVSAAAGDPGVGAKYGAGYDEVVTRALDGNGCFRAHIGA
jgi:hypothetical protein